MLAVFASSVHMFCFDHTATCETTVLVHRHNMLYYTHRQKCSLVKVAIQYFVDSCLCLLVYIFFSTVSVRTTAAPSTVHAAGTPFVVGLIR